AQRRGRRQLGLFVRELPESRGIAIHDIRGERSLNGVAGLLPAEVDSLAIAGPSHIGGLVSGQPLSAHAVVNRDRGFPWRRLMTRKLPKGKNQAHHPG